MDTERLDHTEAIVSRICGIMAKWQRGEVSWAMALTLVDGTDRLSLSLSRLGIGRGTSAAKVRALVTLAVKWQS